VRHESMPITLIGRTKKPRMKDTASESSVR
jgi:hypothetical protein